MRRLVFPALALAVGAAAVLATLEIGLRAFLPQPLALSHQTRERIVRHRPGARIRYVRAEFDHVVTFNRLGLRGPEIPTVREPGETRIFVLGDSYAEGAQVADEETFPVLLERRLAPLGPVVVANGGVAGYGTADELRLFEHLAPEIDPDLVVLGFTIGNDLRNNRDSPWFELDGTRLIAHTMPPLSTQELLVSRMKELAASKLHLVQFVRDRLQTWRTPTTSGETLDDYRREMFQATTPEGIERDWALTEALLDRLNERVRARGATFLLAALPPRVQVEADRFAALVGETRVDPLDPQRRLERWAESRGVPFVDARPALVEAAADGPVYYRIDAHPNPRGHAVIAETIARAITPWLDRPAARRPTS